MEKSASDRIFTWSNYIKNSIQIRAWSRIHAHVAGVSSSASRRFSPNFSLRMLSIITAQACCLANQADTLAIKGTACPILQIHTRSVSCSNKATTSKHKKNQVKHPSDVHLLKFVGTLCISQSAHLDPPSIWTSSHSPGTARVGPHPPGRWLTEGNWLGKYSCWHLFICITTVTWPGQTWWG